MEKDPYIILKSYQSNINANIDRALLEEKNIECQLYDEDTNSILPHLSNALNGVKLAVKSTDFIEARELIKINESVKEAPTNDLEKSLVSNIRRASIIGLIMFPFTFYSMYLSLVQFFRTKKLEIHILRSNFINSVNVLILLLFFYSVNNSGSSSSQIRPHKIESIETLITIGEFDLAIQSANHIYHDLIRLGKKTSREFLEINLILANIYEQVDNYQKMNIHSQAAYNTTNSISLDSTEYLKILDQYIYSLDMTDQEVKTIPLFEELLPLISKYFGKNTVLYLDNKITYAHNLNYLKQPEKAYLIYSDLLNDTKFLSSNDIPFNRCKLYTGMIEAQNQLNNYLNSKNIISEANLCFKKSKITELNDLIIFKDYAIETYLHLNHLDTAKEELLNFKNILTQDSTGNEKLLHKVRTALKDIRILEDNKVDYFIKK